MGEDRVAAEVTIREKCRNVVGEQFVSEKGLRAGVKSDDYGGTYEVVLSKYRRRP